MMSYGQPERDAAGAACRNAAVELEEQARSLQRTCAQAPGDQLVAHALVHMARAARLLHKAANEYYEEERA